MIKDISNKNIEFPNGKLHISIEELISIIETMNFKKVTAKNKNIEFESLQDIKQNRSLMAGQPRIFCDEVIVSFNRFGGGVSLSYDGEDISRAKSFSSELSKRKTIFDKIAVRQRYVFIPYILTFAAIGYFRKNYSEADFPTNVFSIINSSLICVMVIIFSVLILLFYIEMVREPVFYRPSENFFRRNFDKIVLTISGAICGGIISSILSKFSQ